MVRRMLRFSVLLLGALLLLATLLPLIPSDERWIRVFDFPRLQVAVLLLVTLIAAGIVLDRQRVRTWLFVTALLAALAYQAYRIYPYTPLHALEVLPAPGCVPDARVSLLVANVLISNERATPLLDQVRRLKPDLVLLLETDQAWERRLAPMMDEYPYQVCQPQDNSYGMHLFSKLELVGPRVRYRLQESVPSITTRVRLQVGELIDFYGVHPKPPPRQDTTRRDAELLIIGREVRQGARPAIVAGDLNDVAWSRTTRLFQELSGLLDPRIGRGLYPTFNADWPLLRWPLDHVFFGSSFTLREMATLGDIGSDHFPFYIALCYQPQAEAAQETPAPEPEDIRDAHKAIREGKEAE